VITALRTKQQRLKEFPLAECQLRNNQVYYRNQLLVPEDEELRLRIIQLCHDTSVANHSNRVKTYEILSRYYY